MKRLIFFHKLSYLRSRVKLDLSALVQPLFDVGQLRLVEEVKWISNIGNIKQIDLILCPFGLAIVLPLFPYWTT